MLLHLPLLARPNCLSLVTPAPPVISRQSPPRMQAFRLAQFIAFGYVNFGARGFRRNEKTFTPNVLDVHLTDKHYIVTGATSGLGRITAEQLAHRGASVHLLCRDAKRAQAIQEDIMRKTTNENITVHLCDMSSLADVVAFSREWEESGLPIHALVNNAGVMLHSRKQSADGIETNFATNSLGTFALTEMLRPALERSKGARVVTVSSGGMLTQGLEVDDFEGTSLSKGDSIDGSAQYSRSKRHQVAMTEYWARKYADSGIFWASMHPGWAGTPGLEKSMPDFFHATKNQLRSQQAGADTIVYLAASEEALKYESGDFFFDRSPAAKHLWLSGTQYDDAKVDVLMKKMRSMVEDKGFRFPT